MKWQVAAATPYGWRYVSNIELPYPPEIAEADRTARAGHIPEHLSGMLKTFYRGLAEELRRDHGIVEDTFILRRMP